MEYKYQPEDVSGRCSVGHDDDVSDVSLDASSAVGRAGSASCSCSPPPSAQVDEGSPPTPPSSARDRVEATVLLPADGPDASNNVPGSRSADVVGRRVGPTEIDNTEELKDRYDPECMRHLDVDKALEELMASTVDSAGIGSHRHGAAEEGRWRGRGGGLLAAICVLLAPLLVFCCIAISAAVLGATGPDREDLAQFFRGAPIPAAVDPGPNFALVDRTEFCRGDSVLTRKGRAACERACLSATCCHEPPGDELSCVSRNAGLCRRYDDACGILQNLPPGEVEQQHAIGMEEVPPAPPNLEDLCDSVNVESADGYAACEEACRPSRCCKFRGGSQGEVGLKNCLAGNERNCRQYKKCYSLPGSRFDYDPTFEKEMSHVKEMLLKDKNKDNHSSEEETAKGDVSEGRTSDADEGEIIADVCSERSLQTAVGRMSCSEICESHLCCFEGGGKPGSCPEQTDCFRYLPCQIIASGGLDEEIDLEKGILYSRGFVSAVCSETSLVEPIGVMDCHNVCDAHMCCFVDNYSECPAKGKEKCDVFEPCRVLLT